MDGWMDGTVLTMGLSRTTLGVTTHYSITVLLLKIGRRRMQKKYIKKSELFENVFSQISARILFVC